MAETLKEQLERLHLIASGDRDCDMSDNDLDALRAVLMTVDELRSEIQRLRSHPGIDPFADGKIKVRSCPKCGEVLNDLTAQYEHDVVCQFQYRLQKGLKAIKASKNREGE